MRLILFFSIFITSTLSAQIWNEGTAYTINKQQLKVAVFMPASYGITSTLEVSSQIPAFVVNPNVSVKKRWSKLGYSNIKAPQIVLASRHSLWYPSIGLKYASKHGTKYPGFMKSNSGEIVTSGTSVPSILVFTNEVIASYYLQQSPCGGNNFLLSAKLGLSYGFKSKPHTKPIYYPLLYTRTSVFQDTTLWYAGLDLDALLTSYIGYSVDLDFYSVGIKTKDWALEHKAMLIFSPTEKIKFLVGYKTYYGDTGIGKKLMFSPLVDFIWYFKFERNEKRNLFEFDTKKAH